MAINNINADDPSTLIGRMAEGGAVEAANKLHDKLHQLRGLTGLTYGCGQEGFSSLSDDGRDAILWLISDMVEECHTLSAAAFGCVKRTSSPELSGEA